MLKVLNLNRDVTVEGCGLSDSTAPSTQGLRDVFVVLRTSLDGDGMDVLGQLVRVSRHWFFHLRNLNEVQPGADMNAGKSELHKAIDNGDGLGFF